MKKTTALVLAFVAMTLSGCYTTASPEGVVRSAYKALMKNDVKKFPKFLTGEAKAEYGTLKGMGELQDRLAPFAKVDIGTVDLIDTQTSPHGKDFLRTFSVSVLGAAVEGGTYADVLSATVACEVRYHYEHSSNCMPAAAHPHPGHPGHPGYYDPGYYGPYPHCHTSTWERETMYCRISKID